MKRYCLIYIMLSTGLLHGAQLDDEIFTNELSCPLCMDIPACPIVYTDKKETSREFMISFYDANQQLCEDDDGIAGWILRKTPDASKHELMFFDRKTKYKTNYQGIAGWVYQLNKDGQITRWLYLDKKKRPCLKNERIAGWESDYQDGLEIKRTFLGRNGLPWPDSDHVLYWTREYDTQGYEIKRRSYGIDNKLVLNDQGHSGWNSSYDGQGNEIMRIYVNNQGENHEDLRGIAGWQKDYNALGKCIRHTWIDSRQQPHPDEQGITTWKSDYVSSSEISRLAYNLQGNPTQDGHGIAGWLATYDKHGHVTRFMWVDAQGNHREDQDHIAGWVKEYDPNTQEFKIHRWIDGNGQVCLDNQGVAGWKSVRNPDIAGWNRYLFIDQEDQLVANKEGVVGWESEFTANWNQIHFVYLDRSFQPMPVSEYTLPADVPSDENACKRLPVRHGDHILLKKGTFVRGCSNHHLCLSAGNLSWKELEKNISWISAPAPLHIDRNNKEDSYIKLYDKSFFVKKDIIVKIKCPLHVTTALYLENRSNPTGRRYLGPWVPIKDERGKYIQEDETFLNQ